MRSRTLMLMSLMGVHVDQNGSKVIALSLARCASGRTACSEASLGSRNTGSKPLTRTCAAQLLIAELMASEPINLEGASRRTVPNMASTAAAHPYTASQMRYKDQGTLEPVLNPSSTHHPNLHSSAMFFNALFCLSIISLTAAIVSIF